MTVHRMADMFDVRGRFLRSAHLERDFRDPRALDGYVLTEEARGHLARLAAGLAPQSGRRAWRITGDYGSGKSLFALLLAQLLSDSSASLPRRFRSAISFRAIGVTCPYLLPVLVTGSRSRLSGSLLAALASTLSSTGRTELVPLVDRIEGFLRQSPASAGDEQIVEFIQRASSLVIEHQIAGGILVVIDELGRFLEFAALRPDEQDVGFLQSLAELACRSGNKPVFVVGLLHQGFNAYAEHLSQPAQKEWEKVAGRFEELVFAQPPDQVVGLVADAINVRTKLLPDGSAAASAQGMEAALDLGWYGAAPARLSLMEASSRIYPLHPTVVPVLIRFLRRFGQNERSLFSFLLASEEHGLMDFCRSPLEGARFFRLHNLYDYVRSTFGHRLAVQSYRGHWNQIDSVVQSFAAEESVESHVLKTVGILNLLDSAPLIPTREAVAACLSDNDVRSGNVQAALDHLTLKASVLYRRGSAAGYCLWPFTSVNLERAYEEAKHTVGPVTDVRALVKDYLEEKPLVARRHYVETGNLRYFRVVYGGVAEVRASLRISHAECDGMVLVPLSETEEQYREALEFARSDNVRFRRDILVAVARPLHGLGEMFREVKIWEWIVSNTPELNNDPYAAEEVSRQIIASKQILRARVQSGVSVQHFASSRDVTWFRMAEQVSLAEGKAVLQYLSDVCDQVYESSPVIANELVNRRSLSSAAAAARMRLIERMFSNRFDECLGLPADKKPPEMSMYLSVLQRAGLHARSGSRFDFRLPADAASDKCRVVPAIAEIDRVLKREEDARVSVSDIFDALRSQPFGVREGLLPILLATYTLVHEQDIAFYENGSFLRHVDGLCFQRLIKHPELFEMQYCSVSGIRAELFSKLLSLLGVAARDDRSPDVLDIVRPLCAFAARLPEFVHKTHRLSPESAATRAALLDAREPGPLLFEDLPRACGMPPFRAGEEPDGDKVRDLVSRLESSISELRSAYADLCERLSARIAQQFDLTGPIARMREDISARATRVMLYASEPRLRAFCLRLSDVALSDTAWIESLGSLLVSKPPSRWVDLDESTFTQELCELSNRFRNAESIVFGEVVSGASRAARVSITQMGGYEASEVLYTTDEEEDTIAHIEADIHKAVAGSSRLGKAALSRVMWRLLSKSGTEDERCDGSGGVE